MLVGSYSGYPGYLYMRVGVGCKQAGIARIITAAET